MTARETTAVAAASAAGMIAWNSFVLPLVPARRRAAANVAAAVATVALARRHFSARELGLVWSPSVARASALAALAPAPLWVASAIAARRAEQHVRLPDDLIHPAEWLAWRIPVGTAISEELFFRSVLHALDRPAISAAAFGIWHARLAHTTGEPVAAVVAATTAAGVMFDVVRARTGSVVVPMVLHASINLGGAVAVLLAERSRGGAGVDPGEDVEAPTTPLGTVGG